MKTPQLIEETLSDDSENESKKLNNLISLAKEKYSIEWNCSWWNS